MSTDTIGQYRLNTLVELTRESCCVCGIQFAMPTNFRRKRLDDHQERFWCPNGHSLHFIGMTEAERLQGELEDARRANRDTRRELAYERRSHAATKGKVTTLRKRAEAGVCAYCRRTFQNYARHMETKHPKEPR